MIADIYVQVISFLFFLLKIQNREPSQASFWICFFMVIKKKKREKKKRFSTFVCDTPCPPPP